MEAAGVAALLPAQTPEVRAGLTTHLAAMVVMEETGVELAAGAVALEGTADQAEKAGLVRIQD
jgi:hypothetical protein